MAIPALHDAANDRPIPYTPVCGHAAGIPVCLNPAYASIMADVTSALRPVLGEVAGLPGAPVRAVQVAGTYSSTEGGAGQVMTISGVPPVLRMPLDAENLPGVFGGTTTQFAEQMRLLFAHAFVGAGIGAGTRAQQAVQAALLQGAGVPFAAQPKVLSGVGLPSWALATLAAAPRGRADGRGGRPGRSMPRPGGWPRYRPRPGMPGSRRTWPRCAPGDLTLAQLP